MRWLKWVASHWKRPAFAFGTMMLCAGIVGGLSGFAVNGVFANVTASGYVNSTAGFEQAGAAASNHLLVGNGTNYVDAATLPSVTLPTIGTAGTYSSPISLTTDVYGRVTAITSTTAVSRTCNANGCYKIDSDGTITEWGETTNTSGGDVVLTFPYPLTTVVAGQTSITFGADNTGGSGTRGPCFISATLTTTGTTVSTNQSTNLCPWQLKGW